MRKASGPDPQIGPLLFARNEVCGGHALSVPRVMVEPCFAWTCAWSPAGSPRGSRWAQLRRGCGAENAAKLFCFLSGGCRPAAGLWAYPRRFRGFPRPGVSPGGRGEPQIVAAYVEPPVPTCSPPSNRNVSSRPLQRGGMGECRHSGRSGDNCPLVTRCGGAAR